MEEVKAIGEQRAGCAECRRLRDEFARAVRSGDRAGAEGAMAARGLHEYAAHGGRK
ncbi:MULTISPECIES: hypothetical protein [Streptomyces]|uniref:hypothetical protein n=1 Tax=Streptomyces TaxID=1883 RepID=UPI00163BD586|nr:MULTISPECIES: hypothetical protein [Streptomyces]MBC2875527.1 hypothetical protein [Streptomyces sp. TYQ1024]UBI35764.1 hypothetical protein K7I03_04305 [Streptomyces mobaraensis]UKW28357.1 hypothetical protein MCU78_04320 [Streptomyces sp. TYQ1024]